MHELQKKCVFQLIFTVTLFNNTLAFETIISVITRTLVFPAFIYLRQSNTSKLIVNVLLLIII